MQAPILNIMPALKSKTYQPAFPVTPTTTIKYALQPPRINAECKEIPVDEFAKSEGIQWVDSPVCETQVKEYVEKNANKISEMSKLCYVKLLLKGIGVEINNEQADYKTLMRIFLSHTNRTQKSWEKSRTDVTKQLEQFLSNSPLDLIIADIDKTVGKGVFLSPHAKPIKKGSIVCIYTGQYRALTHKDADAWRTYDHDIFEHPIFELEPNKHPYIAVVDAEKYGNIARYMQDLPTADDLKHYTMPDDVRARVATANIESIYAYVYNFPVSYFEALRDIQPGEMLGYSYGKDYWAGAEHKAGIKHKLFDSQGRIIEKKNYQYNLLHLTVKKPEGGFISISPLYNQVKIIILNCIPFRFGNQRTGNETVFTDTELAQAVQLKMTEDPTLIQDPQMKELSDILMLKKEFSASENDPVTKREIQFSCNIKFALMKHQAHYEYTLDKDVINPQRVSYIKLLLQQLMPIPNTDAQKISNTLKATINTLEYSTFFKTHLNELRGELMQLIVNFAIANKAKNDVPVESQIMHSMMRS